MKGFRISRWAIGVLLVGVLGLPAWVSAATRCAPSAAPSGGCTTTHASEQAALDAAQAGDTVSLPAGVTHTGTLILRNKGVLTQFITITTDAASINLPAATARTCGGPYCGVDRSAPSIGGEDLTGVPDYSAYMPKLKSAGGGEPAVRVEAGANHYKFQHIDFPPVPQGYNQIIAIGEADSTQQFESQEPSYITFDQCYLHGDPVFGQKRAWSLQGKNIVLVRNFVTGINSVGEDGQVIAGWNGHGPVDIQNNFLEGGTETILFGGADPTNRTYLQFSGTPTTTGGNVFTTETGHTCAELKVGQFVPMKLTAAATTLQYPALASITGTGATCAITWTPATPTAPDATGTIHTGVVVDGVTIRFNHVTWKLADINGVLSAPAMTSATAGAGGTLTGTYFYKAQAFSTAGYQGQTVKGALSATEVSATASGQKITVVIGSVSGATGYYLFRATATGAQNQYTICTTTTCVDDGTLTWTSGTPGAATFWQKKNLIEFKAAYHFQVDSNYFDNCWKGSDAGQCGWFKAVNQEGGGWWQQTAHGRVEKNVWDRVDGWLNLHGQESEHGPKPPPMTDVVFKDNLIKGSNSTYSQGDDVYAVDIADGTVGMTFDHNTINHRMKGFMQLDGTPSSTLVVTNNMARGETYGIHASTGEGTQALSDFAPGYTFSKNALSNVSSSLYPTNNTYESNALWEAEFTTYTADGVGANFALAGGSALNNAGTDGADVGADIVAVLAAVTGVTGGSVTALRITPSTLPNAVRTVAYSQTLVASGGTAPYTWAITAGALPTSVTLNTSSGLISGTPTVAGSYTFTARATDNVAATASQAYTVIVRDPVSITTTSPLAGATQNSGYSTTVAYTGGEAPFACTVTSGSLPTGLSLGSTTCALSGTPTTLGANTFTVQVAGALGSSASRSFSLIVAGETRPAGRPGTSGPVPLQASVFRGSAAPTLSTAGCCVKGDLWIDTSGINPMLKTATSVAGSVTWTTASSGILLSGNGSGITNLNASQLTTGTIPSGVFPANLSITSSVSAPALDGATASLSSFLKLSGSSCTSLAASGEGKICYDLATNTLKASVNGGAYASLGAGGTTSGGASLANSDSTLTFSLSSTDASDSYGFGMSTGNGRKASLLSLQGTKYQAMQFGDATNDTDYIWAIGTSNDAGATWARWIGVRHDGVVSQKNLTLDSQAAGTCNAANRGRIVYVAGGTGVADLLQICVHKSDNSYAFVSIVVVP